MNQGELNNQLMIAVKNECSENIRELVKAGADVNAFDKSLDGFTPLMEAAFDGHGVIQVLLDLGANVNFQNSHNVSALMLAVNIGGREAVNALILNGADVNAQNSRGMTPLMYALGEDVSPSDIVEILLKADADISLKHLETGGTALDMAIGYEDEASIELIEAFIKKKELISAAERIDDISSVFGIGGR